MTEAPIFRRDDLAQFFGSNLRLMTAFEDQATVVAESSEASTAAVAATDAMKDATVVVLSANGDFTNERVLRLEDGLEIDDTDPAFVTIRLNHVARTANHDVTLIVAGDSEVEFPISGKVATREGIETFQNKTLDQPSVINLGNYANDAAAAAGGVPLWGMYRNGSALMVRVV